MASSFMRFLDHTQQRSTVSRIPLEEWSARHRDLYLTTHNTHKRQTSMPPGGIWTHDLSKRAAADLRLRPRGYWDWHVKKIHVLIYQWIFYAPFLQLQIMNEESPHTYAYSIHTSLVFNSSTFKMWSFSFSFLIIIITVTFIFIIILFCIFLCLIHTGHLERKNQHFRSKCQVFQNLTTD